MSDLQNAVINQYKQAFPQDKLRHISEKTSIQITRVFRILNGSEMKISEYEAFIGCLESNQDFLEIRNNLKELLSFSKPSEVKKLNKQLLHKISLHKLLSQKMMQESHLNLVGA